MNRFHTAAFTALALFAAGAAAAAPPLQFRAETYPEAQIRAREAAQGATALTRAQVRAELDAARRDGDLVAGDLGLKLNEVFPSQYARGAAAPAAVKSAEQARAERRAALFAGSPGALYAN